jgi:LacI family transcriptional regulator
MIKAMEMNRRKSVTLKAVAERAGTSIQTVSTVLNNSRSNTVVSAETRARILSVAEEMQYRRNALARSLRRGYTNIIGFYSGHRTVSHTNPFLAEVFGGIQLGCNEYHKDLLIHGTFRGDSVDDIYNELTSGKIDGLVIFASTHDNLVRRLQASPLAVVAIADALPGIRSITMDDHDAARQVIQHLHERGHRHVLYRYPPDAFTSAFQRLEGLQAEGDRIGVRVTPIVEVTNPPFFISEREKVLLTSQEEGRATAIVCWCDASAEAILQFLFDNRIPVPQQMAVVGFDGFKLPYAGGAQLTTMVAPWAEAGHRAVSLLMDAESDDSAGNEVSFRMQLRRGNTT